MKIVTSNTPWPNRGPRIASINSFGYGGANAHTILQDTSSFIKSYYDSPDTRWSTTASTLINGHEYSQEQRLLIFSAHNKQTLMANIKALGTKYSGYSLADLSYTLGSRRSYHIERSFLVCRQADLPNALLANDHPQNRVHGSRVPSLGFVFTGRHMYILRLPMELKLA